MNVYLEDGSVYVRLESERYATAQLRLSCIAESCMHLSYVERGNHEKNVWYVRECC